jgi:hypothetical protein
MVEASLRKKRQRTSSLPSAKGLYSNICTWLFGLRCKKKIKNKNKWKHKRDKGRERPLLFFGGTYAIILPAEYCW